MARATKTQVPVVQEPQDDRIGSAIRLAVCLAVGVFCLATVWSIARPIGDMYVGLAAGRDIMQGRLGQPDDWSFMTQGRVWINQNWGTHLMFFFFNWVGAKIKGETGIAPNGDEGILVLKAMMLLGLSTFMVQSARQRGAGWPVAILTAGAIVASAWSYIDTRPNLTSLTFAPLVLWLIYLTRRRSHLFWLVAAAVWLWGNMHGGYIFGLGMMGLWAGCRFVSAAAAEGWAPAIRRTWPLFAATAAAFALTMLANPFPITNFTHPFVVARSEVWREVAEWRPVYVFVQFGTIGEFFGVIGLLSGLMAVRILVDVGVRRRPVTVESIGMGAFSLFLSVVVVVVSYNALTSRHETPQDPPFPEKFRETYEYIAMAYRMIVLLAVAAAICLAVRIRTFERPSAEQATMVMFETVVVLVSIGMAMKSRRFCPLAIIMSAPFLAVQADWLLRLGRFTWPTVAAAVALAIPVGAYLTRMNLQHYWPDNPKVPAGTIAQKMHLYQMAYSPQGADFINRNGIGKGDKPLRTFIEWRWEGFCRWTCPQLKTFMGGRAQQVHDEDTFKLRQVALQNELRDRKGLAVPPRPGRHVAVVPVDDPQKQKVGEMVPGPDGPWMISYTDGQALVLVDANSDETKWIVALKPPYANMTCAIISAVGVHLAFVPWDDQHGRFVDALLRGGWAIIYADGHNVIMADCTWEETWGLVQLAARGKLDYPTPALKAMGRVVCMGTIANRGHQDGTPVVPLADYIPAIEDASHGRPAVILYNTVLSLASMQPPRIPLAWAISYFVREDARLAGVDVNTADGLEIIHCRRLISNHLVNLYGSLYKQYGNEPDRAERDRWEKAGASRTKEFDQIVKKWD